MSAASQRRRILFTEDEYLARERVSKEKHEFVNGDIYAMAGASVEHNLVATNLLISLGQRLRGRPCKPLGSDQRIHVPATGMYTYPDVSVVCGKIERAPKDSNTIINPLVLAEVLSPSTAEYDKGDKFAHYRSILSLREVLFLSQTEHLVEHYGRTEVGQWLLTEVRSGEIRLPALGVVLSIEELYDGFELLSAGPPAAR